MVQFRVRVAITWDEGWQHSKELLLYAQVVDPSRYIVINLCTQRVNNVIHRLYVCETLSAVCV